MRYLCQAVSINHCLLKREIRITEDGSHTFFLPEMDETYHSIHGALQESKHVFLRQGYHTLKKEKLRILETGFGTGLNALLTLAESVSSGQDVYYHAVEKYPLRPEEYSILNFEHHFEEIVPGSLTRMHDAPWGEEVQLNDHFTLFKEYSDFRLMEPPGMFDLVYFDAFDPQKQPHLWTQDIFCRISKQVKPGGILVTYSVRGSVRRALISCGFQVEKVPGPPGKREMIRATRI